jgi:hypothetical protein
MCSRNNKVLCLGVGSTELKVAMDCDMHLGMYIKAAATNVAMQVNIFS